MEFLTVSGGLVKPPGKYLRETFQKSLFHEHFLLPPGAPPGLPLWGPPCSLLASAHASRLRSARLAVQAEAPRAERAERARLVCPRNYEGSPRIY